MSELNKNQTLALIKKSNINSSTVEYNQNYFTINIQGELMKKEEPTISLKSIYELIINLKDETNKRFDKIENRLDNIEIRLDKHDLEFKNINGRLDNIEIRLDNIEIRLDNIEKLPTIAKELNESI